MDLDTVRAIVVATDRADLAALGDGGAVLAGGSWLFSEPQDHLTHLVDITALGWAPLTVRDDGLEIAATCTLADLVAFPYPPDWPAARLFEQCCGALLASWKIWAVATVGGNVCLSLPAGALISLLSSLDASALIWSPTGDYRIPVADFVTGAATNVLRRGEVLRSLHVPAASLRSRTAFRKVALAPLGRSGAVVIGRQGEDGVVLTVTAATTRPVRFTRVDEIDDSLWFDDPHGTPLWRRHVTGVLAEQIARELR